MPRSYPNRKSPRLKDFDYSSEGWYFVTICTKDRMHYFGQVGGEKMYLSDMGQVVHDYWRSIPDHFAHVILGEMVVMPNHVHGIIGLFYPSEKSSTEAFPDESLSAEPSAVRTLHCNVRTNIRTNDHCIAGTNIRRNGDNSIVKNQHLSHISPKSGSLSHIMRTYKATCTRMIHQITDQPFAWHSRYHDRIIRNHAEMRRIENYIRRNPEAWSQDKFFSDI